ncbi:MAG: LamG domain-containing protein, partial [Acidobacteria bacterium]|nr:LamG domain-containing protein [Acidobacteriota bacterium]
MKDSTSNHNHGSSRGGTAATARVPGKIGSSLQFDGKEGFLEHPHARSLILDRLTPFTLEAWIRTSEPVNQSIMAKQNLEFRRYHLLLDNRPEPANPFVLRLVMPAVPARNEIKVIAAQPLTDGQWHYVVASYDGSGKATGVKLYVDGKPEKSEIVYDSLRDSLDVD